MGSAPSKFRAAPFVPLRSQTQNTVRSSPKKILLLGTSDSGKSTLLKQIQLECNGWIDSEDRSCWVETICHNIVDSIQHLIECRSKHGIFTTGSMFEHTKTLLGLAPGEINIYTAETIRIVWADPATQRFVEEHRAEALLYDCSAHFLGKVVEVGRIDYWPTDEDIFLARRVSTGISVWQGIILSTPIEVYDVGGARSERKKWVKCFDDVSVIFFCASLTDYSKTLREDTEETRLADSLRVFESIANSPYFQNTRIVLVLTKSDAFGEQIESMPLKNFWHDYAADASAESGVEYIRNRYLDLCQQKEKHIATLVLNMTDAQQVNQVLSYIP